MQKRWFSLTGHMLYYSELETSAQASGSINLLEDVTRVARVTTGKYPDQQFHIVTPKRTYVLVADNTADRERWIEGTSSSYQDLPESHQLDSQRIPKALLNISVGAIESKAFSRSSKRSITFI